MKNVIVFFTIGLFLFLSVSVKAQEATCLNQTDSFINDNLFLVESELVPKNETQPMKDAENPINKEGLYHIIVLTKDLKGKSIWVELKHGEQKYVTIKLDNGAQKNVSIRLNNNEKRSKPIKVGSYDRFSELMLQPISF